MEKDSQTKGLYNPAYEHDSCGVGFVVNIKGKPSHDIVKRGVEVLRNLEHRGAELADNKSGDGAGIMIQIPRDVFLMEGINLPASGEFATGLMFLSKDEKRRSICLDKFKEVCTDEGIDLISFRNVPVNSDCLGEIAFKAEPYVMQFFVTSNYNQTKFERKIYIARKRIENEIEALGFAKAEFYMPSFSNKVIIYKGMLTAGQIEDYYLDLKNEGVKSAMAVVHSRFSTNTFPSWFLAQPFRYMAHNGEINTIKGNEFWMQARESLLKSDLFGKDLEKVFPVVSK